jgi:2-keto-4-pentenoate hydratase/2-oxohepta-3-ene-1,7-dioic acid hydratase in catechol pathway
MAMTGRDMPVTMLDLVTRAGSDAGLLPALAADIKAMPADSIIRQDDNTDWLPPIGNPSKILGVAFNNRELMKKAHHDPGVPNFFLKPPSCLTGNGKPVFVDPDWGAVIP